MSADYESVLCVKPEVHVYKIPPRTTNRGYRAADWKLDVPDWTGRLRVVSKGNDCFVKLEDKQGELFAQAPVDSYPGIAVEAVLDSSRYFVVRIQNENGRHAFIGVGFTDRGDSFDFNVALQDHFKYVKQSKQIEEDTKSGKVDTGPKLDLGFKEGQTITLNIGSGKKGGARPRSGGAIGGGVPGLLPPPPGGKMPTIPSPNQRTAIPQQQQQTNSGFASSATAAAAPSQPQQTSNLDLLGGFSAPPQQQSSQGQSDLLGGFGMSSSSSSSSSQPAQQQTGTDWGDFESAGSAGNSSGNSWVQF